MNRAAAEFQQRTGHPLHNDKYVQAGGLFIFEFSHAKKTADPDWN